MSQLQRLTLKISDSKRRVYNFVKEHPETTKRELCAFFNIRKPTLNEVLLPLVDASYIKEKVLKFGKKSYSIDKRRKLP